MTRVEREMFRTAEAFLWARRAADEFDTETGDEEREDGEWSEFVQWKAGYDLTRELVAAGVPDDLIESESAAIFALA